MSEWRPTAQQEIFTSEHAWSMQGAMVASHQFGESPRHYADHLSMYTVVLGLFVCSFLRSQGFPHSPTPVSLLSLSLYLLSIYPFLPPSLSLKLPNSATGGCCQTTATAMGFVCPCCLSSNKKSSYPPPLPPFYVSLRREL